MTRRNNLTTHILFEDAFCGTTDSDFAYGIVSGTVGILVSLLYIVFHTVCNGWAHMVQYEGICVLFFLVFMLCWGQSTRRKELLWSCVGVSMVVATIVLVASISHWKLPHSFVIAYLLQASMLLCLVSVIFFARSMMHRFAKTDEIEQDMLYVSRLTRRSRDRMIPKSTMSVSLHPSYEVVSSPSESHLRIQPVVCPSSPVTVNQMFLSLDRIVATEHDEDMLCRLKKKSLSATPRQRRIAAGHPPELFLVGALLSLVWLGLLAVLVFDKLHMGSLQELSQEMTSDSSSLVSEWESVQASASALETSLREAAEAGALGESQETLLTALEQLSRDMQNMNSATRTASAHLQDHSHWTDIFYHSLLLAVRIGACVAIAVGAASVVLSVRSAFNIREDMQSGVWRAPGKPKPPSEHAIVPLGTTLVGTQLGLILSSFVAITAVVAGLAFLLIMPPCRYFLWFYRYHALAMVVMVAAVALVGWVLRRHAKETPPSRYVSERWLARGVGVLSVVSIIPGHVIGVLQYICVLLKGLLNWGRVDVPTSGFFSSCLFGSAHRVFLGLLLLEVCVLCVCV